MKEISEKEMLHRAAAYCSSTERCIREVESKIKAAGFDTETTERIISGLIREKFIDENRYCQAFINDKIRFNKWGRIKIRHELRNKNIPENIYSHILDAIDPEEYYQNLISLLKTKKKTTRGKDERDIFYKLMRFAAGRGFESGEIIRALKELGNTNDDLEENSE